MIAEATSLNLARDILGKNSFFVKEWKTHYGVDFPYPLVRDAEFPWGEEILRSRCPLSNCGEVIKNCHFGFLEPTFISVPAHRTLHPLNIMHLHTIHPPTARPRIFYNDPWYRHEEFANILPNEWLLIPRLVHLTAITATKEEILHPEEEDIQLDAEKQVTMLGDTHELPMVQTELLKRLLYFVKNGVYPNRNPCARTKERTSRGLFTTVSDLGPFGFVISNWCGLPDFHIGVGASLKHQF